VILQRDVTSQSIAWLLKAVRKLIVRCVGPALHFEYYGWNMYSSNRESLCMALLSSCHGLHSLRIRSCQWFDEVEGVKDVTLQERTASFNRHRNIRCMCGSSA
jgi:hypothetical protein